MDFRSDLYHAIVAEFARQGISHPEHANVADLATRHLEMLIRRIDPVPRQVHFSDEIHDSLGIAASDVGIGSQYGSEMPCESIRSLGDGFLSQPPF